MVQLGEVIFSNIFYFEILYRAIHYRYFITNTHLFYFNLDFFTILGFDEFFKNCSVMDNALFL